MRFLNLQTRNDEIIIEIILFNEIKTPVGAGSEGLMSESLSRFFKGFVQTEWLIRQMSVHKNGIMKHWLNQFVQNTESFSNKSEGCCEMCCCSA